MSDQTPGPARPAPRVDVSDRNRRLRWQIGVGGCIALIALIAIGFSVAGGGDDEPEADDDAASAEAIVLGELDCPDGQWLGVSTTGEGNGEATPALAMEQMAWMHPGEGYDSDSWRNEGLASAVANPTPTDVDDGSLIFVRRIDLDVIGQAIVTPLGSGWAVSTTYTC